jgi:hypothetical protein
MPFHHCVKFAGWGLLSGAFYDIDIQAIRDGLLTEPLQHPSGQVEGGNPVTEASRRDGKESGAGAAIQHPCRWWRQQLCESRRPGRQLRRIGWVMVPRIVVDLAVGVPVAADFVSNRHDPSLTQPLRDPGWRLAMTERRGSLQVAHM